MTSNTLPQSPIASQSTLFQCVISTQEEAKEMGRHDALAGLKCNPDAYVFAGENSIVPTHFRGDYTFAYVLAKGL